MTVYAVIRKADQVEVYRYEAATPVPWSGMEPETHWHIEIDLPASAWWLYPGPFKDRLGVDALALAASSNPFCTAAREMLAGRLYIDLKNPKTADLLNMLVAAGQPEATPYFPGAGPMTPTKRDAILRAPAMPNEIYGGPAEFIRAALPPSLIETALFTHEVFGVDARLGEDGAVYLADGRWTTQAAIAAMGGILVEKQ